MPKIQQRSQLYGGRVQ